MPVRIEPALEAKPYIKDIFDFCDQYHGRLRVYHQEGVIVITIQDPAVINEVYGHIVNLKDFNDLSYGIESVILLENLILVTPSD